MEENKKDNIIETESDENEKEINIDFPELSPEARAKRIYEAAKTYYNGDGTEVDYRKAFLLFENADSAGADIESCYYIFMGDARQKGEYVKRNYNKAIYWYNKAIEKGEEFGYECKGEIFYDLEQYDKAYKNFIVPKKKTPCARFRFGEMYQFGLYVEKDLKRAEEYYNSILNSDDEWDRVDAHFDMAMHRMKQLHSEIKEDRKASLFKITSSAVVTSVLALGAACVLLVVKSIGPGKKN